MTGERRRHGTVGPNKPEDKKVLSIYLGWLILACAIKLGQINLLLWATVSSDFISGVIKELKPLQKDQDCCQLLGLSF